MDFRALQIDNGDNGYHAEIKSPPISVLGEGGVLVKWAYSRSTIRMRWRSNRQGQDHPPVSADSRHRFCRCSDRIG